MQMPDSLKDFATPDECISSGGTSLHANRSVGGARAMRSQQFEARVSAALEQFLIDGDCYSLQAALVLFMARVMEAHRELELPVTTPEC